MLGQVVLIWWNIADIIKIIIIHFNKYASHKYIISIASKCVLLSDPSALSDLLAGVVIYFPALCQPTVSSEVTTQPFDSSVSSPTEIRNICCVVTTIVYSDTGKPQKWKCPTLLLLLCCNHRSPLLDGPTSLNVTELKPLCPEVDARNVLYCVILQSLDSLLDTMCLRLKGNWSPNFWGLTLESRLCKEVAR